MKQSKEFLDIDVVPVTAGTETKYEIRYTIFSGSSWSKTQEALPNAKNLSKNLWKQFRESGYKHVLFDKTLEQVGLYLYHWMFDSKASKILFDFKKAPSKTQTKGRFHKFLSLLGLKKAPPKTRDEQLYLRICLKLPLELSGFPWEAARNDQVLDEDPIGVSIYFTVIRKTKKIYDQNNSLDKLIRNKPLKIVIAEFDNKKSSDNYQKLDTEKEVDKIKKVTTPRGLFLVSEKDLNKSWEELESLFEIEGPPAIFHFAGHSKQNEDTDGVYLMFFNKKGEPEWVKADRLIATLKTPSQITALVFLNACNTGEAGAHTSMAEILVDRGIPMVLGAQTPLLDKDAVMVAGYFYEQLSDDASFDCALQEARKRLWKTSATHCNWPFIFGMVAHQPYSFYELINKNSSHKFINSNIDITDFGFTQQNEAFRHLIISSYSPSLIIVYGEENSGHNHVMRQAKRRLREKNKTYWEPIPNLNFDPEKPYELFEREMLARMAKSLGLTDNDGSNATIIKNIIEKIKDLFLRQNLDLFVFQFEKPLCLRNNETLEKNHILKIFDILDDFLNQYKKSINNGELSILFFLPIEYPSIDEERNNELIDKLRRSHGEVLNTNVIDKLEPITLKDVAGFLKNTFKYSSEEIADLLVNEFKLEPLKLKDIGMLLKSDFNCDYSNEKIARLLENDCMSEPLKLKDIEILLKRNFNRDYDSEKIARLLEDIRTIKGDNMSVIDYIDKIIKRNQ